MMCVLFHDWSKWEDTQILVRDWDPTNESYKEPREQLGQQRVCNICGKKQLRRIR